MSLTKTLETNAKRVAYAAMFGDHNDPATLDNIEQLAKEILREVEFRRWEQAIIHGRPADPGAETKAITKRQWQALCAYHQCLTLMANSTPEQLGNVPEAAQLLLQQHAEAWT